MTFQCMRPGLSGLYTFLKSLTTTEKALSKIVLYYKIRNSSKGKAISKQYVCRIKSLLTLGMRGYSPRKLYINVWQKLVCSPKTSHTGVLDVIITALQLATFHKTLKEPPIISVILIEHLTSYPIECSLLFGMYQVYNVTELKMINGYQCIWSEQSICTWPVFEPLKQWVASLFYLMSKVGYPL